MTNTLLHKVVALQTTPNFQVNRRYVVNYRQPEQPVQVVDGVVTSVTNSTVWFEKLPIPTDSILNVCALLSLPPEVLRLTVSFLDPATQCVIAPTSKLILKSVNEQQSSPGQFISCDQRLLAAWNITQPFLDHICHSISRCSLSFEGIRVQEMESCLKSIPMDFRGYVRDILRHSSSNIRQIEMLLTQRENDPIIRYAQDIQLEVYNCSISCHSPAVQRLEECLSTIPIHFHAPVRDSFRSSEFGFFNIIEALLTQRENNPIIRYAQDIEAHIFRFFGDYNPTSVEGLVALLQNKPVEIRTSVREALRSSRYPLVQQIERRLNQRENNPIIQHAQDIEIFIFRCFRDSDSAAVKGLESLLQDLQDEIRSSVREALRSSEFLLVRDIEGLLTQRENNPIIQYTQDIELSVFRFVKKSDHAAIEGFKKLLQKTPIEIRSAVREALRSSKFPLIQRIERLLTEKEIALATQNSPPSLQTDSTHLGC